MIDIHDNKMSGVHQPTQQEHHLAQAAGVKALQPSQLRARILRKVLAEALFGQLLDICCIHDDLLQSQASQQMLASSSRALINWKGLGAGLMISTDCMHPCFVARCEPRQSSMLQVQMGLSQG